MKFINWHCCILIIFHTWENFSLFLATSSLNPLLEFFARKNIIPKHCICSHWQKGSMGGRLHTPTTVVRHRELFFHRPPHRGVSYQAGSCVPALSVTCLQLMWHRIAVKKASYYNYLIVCVKGLQLSPLEIGSVSTWYETDDFTHFTPKQLPDTTIQRYWKKMLTTIVFLR